MDEQTRILVVDDDESICQSLSLIFGNKGYEVETVGSGREAIEKAKKRSFNIVFLDMRLPDIPGVELIAPLKEMHPDMDVIMITAYASLETAVRALNEGASAYVTKPVNMDEVLARIRDAVRRQHLIMENRRLYQESKRELAERKQAEKALKRANKQLLKEHKQRKALSRRLISLLENDRQQIAMELHDHVGQMLTTLKMELEMVLKQAKSADAATKAWTHQAYDKTLQAMEEIHNIARGLRPSVLDTMGLVPSLRGLFDNMREHTGLEIHFFQKNVPRRFDTEKELAIYRISQEALTNVVKHAHARKVFVNLFREEEYITLSVEDDGVGFDKNKVMKISGGKGPLGLLIMQERALQLDGEFFVESRINGGTHLTAQIPVRAAKGKCSEKGGRQSIYRPSIA